MGIEEAARQAPKLAIPRIVKRNTLLLAFTQMLSGGGGMMAYALGPLMVVALVDSATLAGLSVSLLALSRMAVAYPIGGITDAFGRKPAMMLGLALAMSGGLLMALAMFVGSLPTLVGGILVFGLGLGATHQLRVAAADMYPSSRRAEGVGYVLTGSMVGIAAGALLITAGDAAAQSLGLHPLGLPWLFLPLMILPGLYCIWLVRPDPKYIASNLAEFYPGYRPDPRQTQAPTAKVRATDLLRQPRLRVAYVSNFAAYGNMSIVMVLTSLVLAHHGHGLPAIGLAHSMHTAGMFAFSLPVGWLADRWGRRTVMLLGIVVAAVGALLVTMTAGYWLIVLGTYLVGLGWCAVNISATALIADSTQPWQRGRAVGVNDSVASAGSVGLSIVVGPMVELWGLPYAGVLATVLMVPPLVMLLSMPRLGTEGYPARPKAAGASGRAE
jgi:MFS family permease